MPKRIGITGGIGAGKSTVSKIIESMGFAVFNSDNEAKKIIDTHSGVKTELIALFDASIYSRDRLNRARLAELIFNNPSLREQVNKIVHPRVRVAFEDFALSTKSKLVFNEAAILFETGAYQQFDATVLITSPVDIRIKRLMKRDGFSYQEIEARMNAQWTDNRKAELADYIIINDDTRPLLIQVEEIIEDLLS